jgi:membrane-bound metal-dependent hydrolase YbcI (DUF457 family)
MPFTFSHPAAILPFCKSKRMALSLTGLVVGSIVPDFEFLMRLKETDCFGHTWIGLIAFDIPFAVLLSFLFHDLIRNTLILHLPKWLRQRFFAFAYFDWMAYFVQHKAKFFLSVLIGIFTHVFLDAFTHRGGFFASMHPFFKAEITFLIFPLPVYYILQLTTSLLGALYIFWFILKMEKGEDLPQKNNGFVYWLSLAGITICILAVRLLVSKERESFADIVIASIGSFLYALFMVSVFYSKKLMLVNKKSPNI